MPSRRTFWSVLFLISALSCLSGVQATTLKVISGDEQIQQAETIFRGRVDRIDAARDWSKPRGPIISTIQFTPLALYKGKVPTSVSLNFLGGVVDGLELKVEGMPKFEVGQEYVLFVSGKKNMACPVVGWTEGRLRVNRKDSVDGSVEVTPTTAGWLQHTSIARSRTVMPSDLDLPQFETLLRSRIAVVGSSK